MKVNFVLFHEGQRHDYVVGDGETTIGRREDCGLRVPVADVSRQHCKVLVQAGQVLVKDLGSANGTYVNDRRVSEQSLRPGDLVKVGPCTFTVQIDGKPAQIVAPDELGDLLGDDSGEIPPRPDAATRSAPPPAKPAPAAAAAASKPAGGAPAAASPAKPAGASSVDDDLDFLDELDLDKMDDDEGGADFSALDDLDLDDDIKKK